MNSDAKVVIETPGTRVGRARIARIGEDMAIAYACTACGAASPLTFTDVDYHVQAALHAAMPGCSMDDDAGRRFDQAMPAAPGQRALDCRCTTCGTRFRIIATGGEIDRDGALEYDLVHVLTHRPPALSPGPGPSRVVRGIAFLFACALLVGAGGVVRDGVRHEHRRTTLRESGVTTTAHIVDQTRRYRGVPTIDVTYDTRDGVTHAASIDVPLLSGWHLNDTTVAVRYDPREPSNITIASAANRHAWMQLIGSALLAAPGMMLLRALYRTRGRIRGSR